MDTLTPLLEFAQLFETPAIVVMMFVAYKLYERVTKTTDKTIATLSRSDEKSDDTISGLTSAIGVIAESSQLQARSQQEQNRILKRFGSVLVEIKGDTSATRTSAYSMERELKMIHNDLKRVERKVNRIGQLIYKNSKVIELNTKKLEDCA